MTIDVNTGMSLAEIMAMGEDPSLYSSLTANTIQTTSERVTTINTLLVDLSNVDPEAEDAEVQKQKLIDQIATLAADEKASLETQVQTDLTAQQTLIAANDANDTIHVNVPFNAPSKLFDLVASPLLRTLSDKIIERRLDQDRE